MPSSNRLIKQGGYGRCGCILNTGEEQDLIKSHTLSVIDCECDSRLSNRAHWGKNSNLLSLKANIYLCKK